MSASERSPYLDYHGSYRFAQFGGDGANVDLIGGAGAIIARRAYGQADFSRPRKNRAFRPGVKSTIQITWQNAHVAPCYERADSRFELLGLTGSRARSFGENDQNISGIGEQFGANGKTLSHLRLTRKRQGVDYDGCNPDARHALKKIISRGGRKRAMQFAQRQCRQQAERVEMTAVIGDDDEGSVAAEVFVADNFEAMISAQPGANDQCRKRAHSINEHVGLARKSAKPLNQRLIEIARGIVTPPLHRSP